MRSGQTGRSTLLLLGAVLGAAGALAFLPRARSTATAQLGLALGRPPEWMRALYGGPRPRLERFAATQPEDVELQVALAALPDPEAPTGTLDETIDRRRFWEEIPARILPRLEALARRFPESAPVRAHQLRYLCGPGMSLDHRIEQRALDGRPPSAGSVPPVPPEPDLLRRFDAIAAEGERLEPENAYFTTLRAVAAFATRNDLKALRHLRRAAAKRYWKDHVASEARVQWQLMETVYGDRGALQRVPPLYRILYPHMAPTRATARLALVHAARRERAGDRVEARAIRRHIMGLGAALTDGSPSLIGRLVGIAIFQLGFAPVPPEPPLRIRMANPLTGRPNWRPPTPEEQQRHNRTRRERYAASIAVGEPEQATWIRATGNRLDETQRRYRLWLMSSVEDGMARVNRLTAWWLLGILFWWQIPALVLTGAVGTLMARRAGEAAGLADAGVWSLVYLILFLAPAILMVPQWGFDVLTGREYSSLIALLFLGLLLSGALAFVQWRAHRRAAREDASLKSNAVGHVWLLFAATAAALPSIAVVLLLRGADTLPSSGMFPSSFSAQASLATLTALRAAAQRIYPFQDVMGVSISIEDPGEPLPFFLLPAALPALLLLFLALCRTAANNLPLWSGTGHALRRAAPIALLLLAAIYLASLPSTLAADRSVEQYVEQAMTDELGVTLPGG